METLQIFQEVAILTVTAVGIYCWSALRGTNQEFLPLYMGFVLGVEITSLYIQHYTQESNALVYNIYDIVTYVFFLYWFYKILPFKRLVIALAIVYLFVLSYVIYTENLREGFSVLHPLIGGILILFLVVCYFIFLLNSEKVINFLTSPEFWIVTGLLIFNLGYLPLSLFLQEGLITDYSNIHLITTTLILLLYGSIGASFILQYHKR